jgi:hypothetical protein
VNSASNKRRREEEHQTHACGLEQVPPVTDAMVAAALARASPSKSSSWRCRYAEVGRPQGSFFLPRPALPRPPENVFSSLLSHPDMDPNAVDKNGASILDLVIDNLSLWYGGQIESLLITEYRLTSTAALQSSVTHLTIPTASI